MLRITALLHTHNHARVLGRCLETLHPCDESLIVDHASQDDTLRIAHEYGARTVQFHASASYLDLAASDWILCLDPYESLTEGLAASLFEWKSFLEISPSRVFNVLIREETSNGWIDLAKPETRLVPRAWETWGGYFPRFDPSAEVLEGPLLRFH